MNQEKANRFSIVGFIVVIGIGVLLSGLRVIIKFITDYQWFSKNSFVQTFLIKIKTEAILIIPIWVLITVFLYLYLKKLKNKYYHTAHIFYNLKSDKIIHNSMKAFTFIMGGFISIAISSSSWLPLQMYINGLSFSQTDPIFNKDISFYIFKLPFYELVLNIVIVLTILLAVLTVGFFVFIMAIKQTAENKIQDIHLSSPNQRVSELLANEVVKTALKKISFLGFIVLLMISAKYYLKGYQLMYSTRGAAYGASYTDIHVTLIVYKILSVVSLISSIIFSYSLLKNKMKYVIAVPVILISIASVGAIVGLVVQQLVVEPDEITKEKIYLEYNIDYTQHAFAIEDINQEEFPVEQNLTWTDILDNDVTINNIRINDVRPLQQTYNQIQGIRLYYKFQGIDLDRYVIDGKLTEIFISAREMDQNNLNETAKTWINKYIKYTHGYGIVMSPVNSVTKEGQPELLFKNIPPITDTDLILSRPEIYFGELAERYVVINTSENEFDYPFGVDNKTTRYQGEAGLSLSGINRLLYALREQSMKLFVSSVVNSDSKIILYRNIFDRVSTIAPFLSYDKNPYLVLNQDDGKLYWIIDAYTTSTYYPYSQIFSFKNRPVNYIRNSVKVVVDAYEGTTNYFIYDEDDPLVRTYDKIFTDLFTPIEDFPEGLKTHVKYPQDYFDFQSEVFRSYHVNNPEVFYNGEDLWDIANEKYMDGVQRIESNYVMFKLPDSEKEEFALIIPYTPKEKANMTSLLVARNDYEQYGKLYNYRFPKDKTIQGPMMIESRIDQDSVISPQFTLWGQEGSTVLRGNLIVVPVENSLLYIEPIYLQADNPNSLPEMKRVVVAYQDKIVMAETLDMALMLAFDQTSMLDVYDEDLTPEIRSIVEELNALFNDSKQNMDSLEQLIEQLNRIINKSE